MKNNTGNKSGLARFLSFNLDTEFHDISSYDLKPRIKKSASKLDELKKLAPKDSLPNELIEWLSYQTDQTDIIAEVLSRILLYVSPKNQFEPIKINKWFKRGKLPNQLSQALPSTMTYIFADITKANKMKGKMLKLSEKVSAFDSDRTTKKGKRKVISAEAASAELDILTLKFKELNLLILRKLKEIEAILGSGGSL